MTTTPTFWGPLIVVSSDTSAGSSSIAALSDGQFAVTYQTFLSATSEFNVEGRIVSVAGTSVSGDILAATSSGTTADRYGPEAVQLDNGTLATTFVREFSATDYDPGLALRNPPGFGTGATSDWLLDGSGLNDTDLYETERIDGGFATLYGRSLSSGASDLLLRRFDQNGNQVGSSIDIDGSTDSQSSGDFDVLANGGMVATWSTFNSTTLVSTLWLRLFDANGTPTTGRFSFAGTPNAAFPQVAALGGGGFVAVWQDVNDGGIYHQRYDDRGFTLGARSFTPAGFSILPHVEALRDGGYIVGWSDYNGVEGDGSAEGNVTLQRYSAGGVRVGSQVSIAPAGDQTLEDIQELADGRVAVSYTSETGDATNVNRLLVRILDPRDNHIEGGSGADVIMGREDDSEIDGYDGADTLTGRAGDDVLRGGAGADRLVGSGGDDELRGGSGADTLVGGVGDDALMGGSGDDTLDGGAGADALSGGSGTDVAVYTSAAAGVTADLQTPAGNTGDAAGDTYSAVEGLTGSSFNDVLRGNAGANTLLGGAGADQLVGRDGADVLNGGAGADTLTGGAGGDFFLFNQTPGTANADTIADFDAVADTIQLDDAVFIGLALEALPGGAFRSNTTGNAGDASDRIIYETDTGRLYFDRDGNAGGFASVHFATLGNLAAVSAADFFVV